MKIQNGIVQREKLEVPQDWIITNQWIEGPDRFWYFNSPWNPNPWDEFYGGAIPVHEDETFVNIFGPKPTDVQDLEFWEQQKRLFVKIALPDWVTPVIKEHAELVMDYYGVGKPTCWITIRGDFIVTPTGIPALFNTEDFTPEEVYRYTGTAVAGLQVHLMNKGIKPQVLHPFLSNDRKDHQG